MPHMAQRRRHSPRHITTIPTEIAIAANVDQEPHRPTSAATERITINLGRTSVARATLQWVSTLLYWSASLASEQQQSATPKETVLIEHIRHAVGGFTQGCQ